MSLPKLKPDQSPEDFEALLEQARKASDLLKALSHESRLLILCLLAEGEKSVSELEDIMKMPQAAVSQQLARLRFDRLVNTRREGRAIYYSIASAEVGSVIEALYDLFCAPVRKGEPKIREP
ncbi:ArsR/SmtB family transcription factor [Nitratireductor pacificus]|uniref:Ars family transcriptional regulator SoxR n=1 Tax=Nitratireductor pacificus pht-3B TaxID=391937 RepID=K2M5E0_9HYPH|nr:metalloregulator ArsR/SmtB family transcription factor [Nitratireductor pacificus]EKF17361.1 Ars family transcriptional regulator SoxR [Nitratireductor pacificus pht-3B]